MTDMTDLAPAIKAHYETLREQMPEEVGPHDLSAFDEFDDSCIKATAEHFGITSKLAADIIYDN